jgi:metal-responsive CopG/Arc/MetJ family transcriptional regulator
MRIHVHIDDDLVARLDEHVSPRGRSRFIQQALRDALEGRERWSLIRSAFGSIEQEGHEWDEDPASWVAEQRHTDPGRVG